MTFKDNPDYEIAHSVMHEGNQVDFFVPVDKTNGYHLSRKIAGDAQDSIARLGATVETFETDIDKVNELLNQDGLKNEKRIENAASYLKWIKYRLKHPKNEECALRMAAIFLFIEGENPINSQLVVEPYFLKPILENGIVVEGATQEEIQSQQIKNALQSETERYIKRQQDGVQMYAEISAEFRLAKLNGLMSESTTQ